MMTPSNIEMLQVFQNQGMSLMLGVPRGANAKMMRHELQMLPVEHRAKLSSAKLCRKHKTSITYYNQQEITKWMDR